MKRAIVGRDYYRTPSHPRNAADSVMIRLSCGHEKHYKGSQEPKRYAFCTECVAPRQKGRHHGTRIPNEHFKAV